MCFKRINNNLFVKYGIVNLLNQNIFLYYK